jgi:hypothetical protein
MTSAAIVTSALTHNQWVNQIVEWAHLGGWRVYVMHDSRSQHWATDTGFADVFCVDERGLGRGAVCFECKTGSGRERRDQAAWRSAMLDAGIRSLVVYPVDDRVVQQILLDGIPLHDIVMRGILRDARLPDRRQPRRSPRRVNA